MHTEETQWTEALRKVLAREAPQILDIRLLARTHNLVFELVQRDGRRLILRLHQAGQVQSLHLESEILWLQFLQSELCVPHPIALASGAFLGQVQHPDGLPAYFVIFLYQQGEQPDAVQLCPEHMASLGRFLGRLHAASTRFVPDDRFVRPRLDGPGLFEAGGIYDPGPAHAHFSPVQQRIMAQVAEQVYGSFRQLGEGPDAFGLIHGDLILKNTIWHNFSCCALDFEYCGWGYFLYDLAPLLWQLRTESNHEALQLALWDAYCTERPQMRVHAPHLESLIAGRQLASMRWLAQNRHLPQYQPIFERLIQHRSDELAHFLTTGRLVRKPLPA